jgi:hypothetical protein
MADYEKNCQSRIAIANYGKNSFQNNSFSCVWKLWGTGDTIPGLKNARIRAGSVRRLAGIVVIRAGSPDLTPPNRWVLFCRADRTDQPSPESVTGRHVSKIHYTGILTGLTGRPASPESWTGRPVTKITYWIIRAAPTRLRAIPVFVPGRAVVKQ